MRTRDSAPGMGPCGTGESRPNAHTLHHRSWARQHGAHGAGTQGRRTRCSPPTHPTSQGRSRVGMRAHCMSASPRNAGMPLHQRWGLRSCGCDAVYRLNHDQQTEDQTAWEQSHRTICCRCPTHPTAQRCNLTGTCACCSCVSPRRGGTRAHQSAGGRFRARVAGIRCHRTLYSASSLTMGG